MKGSAHALKWKPPLVGSATAPRMNICAIWDADYPWDVRVQKICTSLAEAGHRVHIVARNRAGRPVEERLPEGTVHRLHPVRTLSRRLDDLSSFPAFVNPRWIHLIHRTAQRTRADTIICRDLPLAPTAWWVGRRLGLPVVLDMAENYPAMIEAVWDHGRQRRMDWLVRNPAAVRWVEKWIVPRVDHILVVIEESRDRLLAMGAQPSRVTVVRNTPPRARVTAHDRPLRPDERLHLVYLGLLELPRGLEVVLSAMAVCRDRGMPVELSVIGTGRDREILEKRAVEARLGEMVRFHGYLPQRDALTLMSQADVGLVPHLANDSWDYTIPNKLFDYMAAGLPVITSDARPAARIVRTAACGEVYPSNQPEALVGAIARLLNHERRMEYSRAARRSVVQQFNWESDSQRLIMAIQALRRAR